MIKEFLSRLLYLVPSQPENVQISITNKCNFDCKMCQRFDLKVKLVHMELETFKTILKKIGNAKYVILTGWGEPLLHPDLLEMIKLCKDQGLNVRFTSNGELLTEELMKNFIELKLDAITFSVDAIEVADEQIGHPIHEQLNKIKQFAALIKQNQAKTEIFLQSTYHKGKEQDLFDVVEFGKETGVDRVRFSRLDTRFHDFDRPSYQDEKKLIKQIEKQLAGSKLGLDFLPHVASDGLAKLVFKITHPFLHRFGKYCLRTYNDVYINVEGEVTPCCALPKLKLGNIHDDNLDVIWNSINFKRFRKNQQKVCGKCDVLKIKTFN
jgi:MoaA/NifB/PqqE/SkfB family radical SAM enzyme